MNNISYADDNTPYTIRKYMECVIQRLKKSKYLFQWFSANKIKRNTDKCHFICISNQKANLTVKNEEIASNICVKFLGAKVVRKRDICKKTEQKINALERIIRYLDFDKKDYC